MRVPLIGAGVGSKSLVVNAQRRLNCYLEPQADEDKTQLAVYGTPGLTKVMDLGALVLRGGITVGDLVYLAQGNMLWEVNNAFAATDRNPASRLTTNTGRMSFSTNETTIVLMDGTNGYNYNVSTNAFAQIASAMFASPQTTTYQDGYYLASFLETGTNKKRCQISADGVTWNALDFRGIDTVPGALIRTLSFNGEVHQFSDKGIEFWAYTGDPTFPFQPIRGASMRIGLAARWSVAEGAGSLYFLGRKGGKGAVQAFELVGHQARSITTPDVSDAFNSYATKGDATGFVYSIDEHEFFELSFPAAGKTWLYDAYASGLLGQPVWSELSSSGGRHLADLGFTLIDKSYVSDYGSGKLYRLDKDVYTDNGTEIAWQLDTRHFFKDYDYVTVDELIADFETGVGLSGPALGAKYLSLPGIDQNYALTNDSDRLDLQGDFIDVRIRIAATDWTPAVTYTLFAKGAYGSPDSNAWAINLQTAGTLNFIIGNSGGGAANFVSTAATGFADGSTHWIRVTRLKSTGLVTFYTSDDYDPATGNGTWTQLGATSILNAGLAPNDSANGLMIGNYISVAPSTSGSQPTSGKVYFFEAWNDSVLVCRFDPELFNVGALSALMGTGETWTIGQSGGTVAEIKREATGTLVQGSDPQVMIRISRDGGRTWGTEQLVPLGKVGQYTAQVRLRRLGTARDFVFRLRITDPVRRVLTGLGIRASA